MASKPKKLKVPKLARNQNAAKAAGAKRSAAGARRTLGATPGEWAAIDAAAKKAGQPWAVWVRGVLRPASEFRPRGLAQGKYPPGEE